MKIVRTSLRLAALIFVTTIVYLCLVLGPSGIGRLVVLIRGKQAGGIVVGRWRTGIFHAWARTLVRVLGIEMELEGRPPEPPFFLVSNHLGYLDIVVLASQVRGVFLSRADVADWPVVGMLCSLADTMFIDREIKRDIPRAMRRIGQVLDSGRGVVVFPEGSSTRGDSVYRFHPSLLEAAAGADLPVSYAALSYRTPEGSTPAHLSVCWWGDMPFGSHVLGLLGLPRIRARLSFGEERIHERDRKLLARRLQYAVEERFQPMVGVKERQ